MINLDSKLNFSKIKEKWNLLLSDWERRRRLPGLVGINLFDDGFALTYVVRDASNKPRLQVCDFIQCVQKDFSEKLAKAVDFHQLKGAGCSWILNRSDYHLLLIDMPNVPAEELQSAIQWLVKDLIDFPIREAVVDFFDIPETIMRDPKKIFVVVSQKNKLQEKTALINATGLHVAAIDIDALALRNLAMLLNQQEHDIALLHIEQDSCSMVILSELFLCLIRQINVTLSSFKQTAISMEVFGENLLAEVKRTMAYCAAQMAHVLPSKIFLLPVSEEYTEMSQYLCKEMPDTMQDIDFNKILEISSQIDPKMLIRGAIAICGALRQEEIK